MCQFFIQEEEVTDHHININIYLRGGLCEHELYLKAYIKWDGMVHLWFGDDGDGYISLYSMVDIEDHCNMLKKLYEYARSRVKCFDC